MDRVEEVCKIAKQHISVQDKIRLLNDVVLDISNELEAQDQNMHPEIQNQLSEGLRLAKNLLRELRPQD